MELDAKTILSVVTALGLAYGELRGSKSVDTARQDVTSGMVSYVSGELEARDAEIRDLRAEIRSLKEQIRGKR